MENNTVYEYLEMEEVYAGEGSQNGKYLEDQIVENIYFYNRDEEHLVANALTMMGFSSLIETFKNEEIDFQAFLNLNSAHIVNILKDFKAAVPVKFEMQYKIWKLAVNSNNEVKESSKDEKILIQPGVVNQILKSTKEGQTFLNKIDKNVKLDKKKESSLCSIILSSVFAKEQLLSTKEMRMLAEDIHQVFPKELPNLYVLIQGNNTSGVLFDKYNNRLRKLREIGLMPPSTRKRKADDNSEIPNKAECFSQDEINSNEFVKHTSANVDVDLLVSHWRRSSRIRIDLIRQTVDKKISSIYRALQRPDGYQLISLDFESLYPNRSFKDQWRLFEPKLLEILKNEIHQSSILKKLDNISKMSANQSLATILLGLHNVLFGDKVSFGSTKKSVYKPTVYDSFNFLLLIVGDENTMEIEYNSWLEQIVQKQLRQQSLIIGFGSSTENLKDKFCVVVEDIRYIFEGENSLLSALECILQIYHVFNLSYPALNSSVYTFLSSQYLSIISGKSKSKVMRMVNAFTE